MPDFFFSFEDREGERRRVTCDDLAAARNEAVRHLGAYLAEHPGFANEGHWRINVEDTNGERLLHVIVATVTAKGAPEAI